MIDVKLCNSYHIGSMPIVNSLYAYNYSKHKLLHACMHELLGLYYDG